MLSLLKIPQDVDLTQPYQVAKAVLFKDAIDGWQDLDNTDYFNWQEFILRSGTDAELDSDNWLDDMLLMSLEKMIRAEVESDLCSLPLSRWSSLTTLHCIIKRKVVKNQEARDTLKEYLKKFDIRHFRVKMYPLLVFA